MVKSKSGKVFDAVNIVFMVVFALIMFYPFYYMIIYSLNEGVSSDAGNLYLYPKKITFQNYVMLFKSQSILDAYIVTIARTVIGAVTSVLFTSIAAYGLSYRKLIFKRFYNIMILIPMFFSGGIIPYYLVIKTVGLYNKFLVYIIPSLFGIWNFIMIRTYFNTIPISLEESAKLDGARDFKILISIIFPMSLPIMATIALFVAVGQWNSWFDAYIYTDKASLATIQLILKNMIAQQQTLESMFKNPSAQGALVNIDKIQRMLKETGVTSRSLQAAASIVTIGPIILVYPFLQKYFIKGVMIGSLKG